MHNLSNKAVIESNVIGDNNINCNKHEPNVKRYKDFMKRHGFINLIKGDTYHHYNGTTSPVDHYLTNNPDLYAISGICPFAQSDHDVIFATRKKNKQQGEKIKILARKYKNMDNEAFIDDMEKHDWSDILSIGNVDMVWDNFVLDLNSILDKHAPWRWMHFEDNLPVWTTREPLSCCKQRDHVEKIKAKISGIVVRPM